MPFPSIFLILGLFFASQSATADVSLDTVVRMGIQVLHEVTQGQRELNRCESDLSFQASSAGPDDSESITASDARECGLPVDPAFQEIEPESLPDNGSVYRVGTRRWNTEWERKFSAWFTREVDVNFMTDHGVKGDCTDAALSMRMIFARMNHLPITLTNGAEKLGQSAKTWANHSTVRVWTPENWRENWKKDLRFRAFVDAARDQFNVFNVGDNLYPVKLTRDNNPHQLSEIASMPGNPVLDDTHTNILKSITPGEYQPIKGYWTSTGANVAQTFTEGTILFQYGNGFPQREGRGIVHWKWAVYCGGATGWRNTASKSMPGYSTEQYTYPREANVTAEDVRLQKAKVDRQLQQPHISERGRQVMHQEQFNLEKSFEKRAVAFPADTLVLKDRLNSHTMGNSQFGSRALSVPLIAPPRDFTQAPDDRTPHLVKVMGWKRAPPMTKVTRYTTFSAYLDRLAGKAMPTNQTVRGLIDLLQKRLAARKELIDQAQSLLKRDAKNLAALRDHTSLLYDDLSTPGRDATDAVRCREIHRLVESFDFQSTVTITPDDLAALEQAVPIPGLEGRMNLQDYCEALSWMNPSSEPAASIEERWGLSGVERKVQTYADDVRIAQNLLANLKFSPAAQQREMQNEVDFRQTRLRKYLEIHGIDTTQYKSELK